MTGIGSGIGAPTSYFGQTFPNAFATQPFGLQSQPLQQSLLQSLQIVPQQLQQLLHILPQQLQQVHAVQQQQLHYLQQLLQIVPQQLHQLQQVVQHLPQQLLQQPFHAAQQPFGVHQTTPNPGVFGGGLSQQATPWGFSGSGQGAQIPQTFGYGAQPGQVM